MGRTREVRWNECKPGYRVGTDGTVQSRRVKTARPGGGGFDFSLGPAWRTLRPGVRRDGSPSVGLGRGDTRPVAALVLESFVGPRPAGHVIGYRDGDPANARLENLLWRPPRRGYKVPDADMPAVAAERARGVTLREIAARYGATAPAVCVALKRWEARRADG